MSSRDAYPSGLALSSDGTQLAVALQRGHSLAIIDTANPAARRIVNFPIPDATRRPFPYAVVSRPGDPQHVYVSLWGQLSVAEVDLGTAAITRTFVVGKNPEELLFSADGARLFVAASDSDAINVIDLSMPAATVRTMYLGGGASAPRGIEPTALAWGPTGRLHHAIRVGELGGPRRSRRARPCARCVVHVRRRRTRTRAVGGPRSFDSDLADSASAPDER